MNSKKHFSGFTGTSLKMIAIVTMLIDHIGAVLLEGGLLPQISSSVFGGNDFNFLPADYQFWVTIDGILRFTGRLAFPIFCFLLVEGFLHTKNAAHYALRLGLFALLSEVPFDFAVYGNFWDTTLQNVFFTLLLGLLALMGIKWLENLSRQKHKAWILLALPLVIVCMVTAEFLRTDYASFGVLLIVVLYLLRDSRPRQCLFGAVSTLWELTAPLAFLPIYFYNGERGRLKHKYFFYWFYPAHLLILAVIRELLF